MPQLSTPEIVEILWEDIENFSDKYHPFEEHYRYYGSSPLFRSDFDSLLNRSFTSTQTLIELAKEGEDI